MIEEASGALIREYHINDLTRLHAINEAAVPGVGSVSEQDLRDLIDMSMSTLVVCIDDRPAGFVLTMTEGLDYKSLNYRWISERYERFAYIDRIAIAPEHRGSGFGQMLYKSTFAAVAGRRDIFLCEVNLEPPNPGSLRFHQSLGFRKVGQRWLPDRSKGVVYLARDLA